VGGGGGALPPPFPPPAPGVVVELEASGQLAAH
jgi:hypothetical protein